MIKKNNDVVFSINELMSKRNASWELKRNMALRKTPCWRMTVTRMRIRMMKYL